MDLESLQKELSRVQEELAKKEEELRQATSKNQRMKTFLSRSMKSDNSRQREVDMLHVDLNDKERKIKALEENIEEQNKFSAQQDAKIAELEEELIEMQNRLQSGVGSEAAQKKNERMQQMLEKSNTLYAELETKYQKICSDLEKEKAKQRKISRPTKIIIISETEAITLNDDNTFSIEAPQQIYPQNLSVINLTKNSYQNDKIVSTTSDDVFKNYLRRVLLEFFIADTSTQTRLIPVILQLLDCANDQIIAAQRGFAEGRQVIAKSGFKF